MARKISLAAGVAAAVTALLVSSPAAASTVTIGANVNDTSNTSAAGCSPACTFQDTADVPAQTMRSPCAGTVTTWRVNAAASAIFSLRLIQDNGDGTFTSTRTSAPQMTSGPGLAVFPTSLPIAAGEYIGVNVPAASVILGRLGVGATGNIFRPPLAEGIAQSPQLVAAPETRLFNADVECPTAPTGQRAAALASCKKRAHKHHWSHKRLRKCKRKANLLPV